MLKIDVTSSRDGAVSPKCHVRELGCLRELKKCVSVNGRVVQMLRSGSQRGGRALGFEIGDWEVVGMAEWHFWLFTRYGRKIGSGSCQQSLQREALGLCPSLALQPCRV